MEWVLNPHFLQLQGDWDRTSTGRRGAAVWAPGDQDSVLIFATIALSNFRQIMELFCDSVHYISAL